MWGIRLALFVSAGVVASGVASGAAPQSGASDTAIPTGGTPRAGGVVAGAAGVASAATFESLSRGAAPIADVATLLGSWSGKCDGEKRELDRIRCQSTRAYLRSVIPRRTFSAVVDDPAVIAVSEFDASIKGYHLSIAGCLACTRPVAVGRTREQRFITLKAPAKEAESLRAAVELSRNSLGFDSLPEARAWLEQSRPDLRTQFVFKPAETEWTFGASRGYALTLLAMRVFNRCTGEILVSRPPSTGTIDMSTLESETQKEQERVGGCRRRDAAGVSPLPAASDATATSDVPPQLSKNDITQAMNTIRPQVFACFEKYKVPGLAQFDFVVAGNGTVSQVRLGGAFFGTPTGTCLLEAAKDAHFPRFARERQQFLYPFFLRQ